MPGVRLVAGVPGSGKTAWCLERVRRELREAAEGPPLILLVPEQASFQTERALLSGDVTGTVRARVLSFNRLGHWVRSLAPGTALPPVEDTHRMVLITSIVARLRREQPDGLSFSHVGGIERAVADLLAEMKHFRVDTARLAELAELVRAEDPPLAAKLDELRAVTTEYNARIAERFEDPETSLATLRETIRHLPELQGARVFVDGFYGFTPVEMEVLRGLVHRCTEVAITLPLSPVRLAQLRAGAEPDRMARAFPIEETVKELIALAADEEIEIQGVVGCEEPHRFRTRTLQHLAAAFQDHTAEPATEAAEGLTLTECTTERDEMRAAAQQILRWRAQHGWRWGEMAVVVRNLEPYALAAEETFSALHIPHYLDRHEPLETHPVIQGTLAALEAILGDGATDRLIEYAKSGLAVGVDPDHVAKLEEFVQTFPRGRDQWFAPEDWQRPPLRSPFEPGERESDIRESDMEALNRTRKALMKPLRKLRAQLLEEANEDGHAMQPAVAAICEFLHESLPHPEEETEQVLGRVGSLFESLIEASGNERFSDAVFLDLMRETFGRLALPRIPPVVDTVMVGSAGHTRLPELRGVVICGLAEGSFPLPGTNATLLTDRERDALRALAGKGSAPQASSRELFQREAFYAWNALSRATHAVALTRPLSGMGTEEASPSPWWTEVRRLFPDVEPDRAPDALSMEGALRAREAAAAVARELWQTQEREAIAPEGPFLPESMPSAAREEYGLIFAASAFRNLAHLDRRLALEAIGEGMNTSVTALESHARCPFQYFMRKTMRPNLAMRPALSRMDIGNLAHATLKALTDKLIAEERGFSDIPESRIPQEVTAAFAGPLQRLEEYGLFERPTTQAAAEFLREQVTDLVRWLAKAEKRLGGRPRHAEWTFGGEGEAAAVPIEADVPGAGKLPVRLRGQIDFVGEAQKDGHTWLYVVDYKLAGRRQKWTDTAEGLSLQLPVYLYVLKHGEAEDGDEKLAGAFFLRVMQRAKDERLFCGIAADGAANALGLAEKDDEGFRLLVGTKNAATATGKSGEVISDAQFEQLLETIEDTLTDRVRCIAEGDVSIRPARIGKNSACSMCDYRSACRVDFAMNSYRTIISRKRDEAIESWLGPAI